MLIRQQNTLALALLCLLWTSGQAVAQITNSIGMRLISVPAGKFYMGSERDGRDADESPVQRVIITKPFLLATTEVTNEQ